MPSNLTIDPEIARRSYDLQIPAIPINAYDLSPTVELERRGADALRATLRLMVVVRQFETVLGALKSQGRYQDLEYGYVGPAHLSIGQEGVAAGTALALDVADHIFGSHRSHGEVIAKGLRAIEQLEAADLISIMSESTEGRLLSLLESRVDAEDARERAEQFLLLGLFAEIFGRESGFNRGMGGSMHAFFPPFGIYPNNAIVGASAGIAAGSALFQRAHGGKAIAVANLGDGSTGCGPVYEALNFASMAQFRTLWPAEHRGALPVLFLFVNNFYAMGGQPLGETHGYERLSRIAAGFASHNLHAETVDGTNALAVADAVERQRRHLLASDGPALLDIQCYRSVGHSTTDGNVYRSRSEIDSWRPYDPIEVLSAQLVDLGVIDGDHLAREMEHATDLVVSTARLAADRELCPEPDIARDPIVVGRLMFNGKSSPAPSHLCSDLLCDPAGSRRSRQIAKRARSGVDASGDVLSPSRAVTIRDALFEAILHRATHDPSLAVWGEEVREWGGAFGVYRGLAEILPYTRLFNSPISEAAIVATAVGYAMEGGRALIELMYADFVGRAGDEIMNQLAKWQAMSGGTLCLPVTLRVSVGSKYGAQHSQDVTSMLAQIPGLRIAYPVTPYDAKGILAGALASDDPTVILESQRLYEAVELFHPGGVPEGHYEIEAGKPALRRSGEHVTILSLGATLPRVLEAADLLAREGIMAEVIDARWVVPFDLDPVIESVSRTGHLLLVSDGGERGSILHTWANAVQWSARSALKTPPRVLGAPNWIVPNAQMENSYYPQTEDIVQIVRTELLAKPREARSTVRAPRLAAGPDTVSLTGRGL